MKIFSMAPVLAALVAACAAEGDRAPLAQAVTAPPRYHVIALPSHGASATEGLGVNDLGWVMGTQVSGDTVHASLWLLGAETDLGTLGGPNSAILWPVKNTRGLLSGVAETAELDPLQEDWSCSAFFPTVTHHVCRGFVWSGGEMRALLTLGGTHGFATGTNNLGQTVGWAENAVHDPTCNPPQVLQFRAVMWGPGEAQLQELPPLPGDTTSSATAVNDAGQVAGISGICANAVGGLSAAHAVLWDHGAITDLGTLGGIAWNTPMAINAQGEVVGFANNPLLANPPTRFRPLPFRWTAAGGMRALEMMPGDIRGQALGINGKGQIVGLACGATCRGFLWEDGVMTDLNSLVAGAPGTIEVAGDINDAGVITGRLRLPSGDASAFYAFPAN